MFRIRKLVRFEMAHRLMGCYSTQCKKLHGHSYVMEVIIEASGLNGDGMILDFGMIKDILNNILGVVDHATLVNEKDPICSMNLGVIAVPYNPTAEEMSKDFCYEIMSKIYTLDHIQKLTVRLHETETGWAEYEMSKNEFLELLEKQGKK